MKGEFPASLPPLSQGSPEEGTGQTALQRQAACAREGRARQAASGCWVQIQVVVLPVGVAAGSQVAERTGGGAWLHALLGCPPPVWAGMGSLPAVWRRAAGTSSGEDPPMPKASRGVVPVEWAWCPLSSGKSPELS